MGKLITAKLNGNGDDKDINITYEMLSKQKPTKLTDNTDDLIVFKTTNPEYNFSLPKEDVERILNTIRGGKANTILYKSYHYKIRTEGRSKFIISKGERISLADVRKWQKKQKS